MDFLTPVIIVVAILGAMIIGFGVWLVVLLAGRLEGTTDLHPPRTARDPTLLLVLGSLVYIVMMLMVYGSGPAVDGHFDPNTRVIEAWLEEVFEAVEAGTTLLLWILLAILLVRDGIRGNVTIVAAVLLPLSGVAAIFAGVLRSRYGGWSIVVPALVPPVIAFYTIWARHPTLNAALPAKIINPAAWGLIVILTLAALPFSAIDAWTYTADEPRRQAKRESSAAQRAAEIAELDRQIEEKHRRDKARFEALNADSSLADLINDLRPPGNDTLGGDDTLPIGFRPPGTAEERAHYDAALAKARQVKTRQSDVMALLNGRKLEPLEDLRALDIEATPALCASYGDALRQEAANIVRSADYYWTDYAWKVELAVERQLPNIRWLVSKHCDLGAVLAFVETRLREFCKPCAGEKWGDRRVAAFADTLAALHRTH